jgi:tetratricopeptide (TPR) repeat protein
LGRVYLYEGQYEIAEHYLRRALRLNSSDADNLIQIASCFAFLGHFKDAEELYLKALQINPLNARNYNATGMLIAFEQGQFEKAITLGLTAKMVWVDFPAVMAAAYFAVSDFDNMHRWWQTFLEAFQKKILLGGDIDETQAMQWIIDVNPYKIETKQLRFFEFISGKKMAMSARVFKKVAPPEKNYFLKEDDLWHISFEGKLILATEAKGFYDLVTLLKRPEEQFHCTSLMGSSVDMNAEPMFDEKAKRSYQKKILELQEEIRWSENNNDLQRTTTLHKEYDDIVDHLTSSLGLKGRIRKSHDTLDKTRSAVTWRIRNAIQKIEKNHPMLGKHLALSIKTGLFCSYNPEKPIHWITDADSRS